MSWRFVYVGDADAIATKVLGEPQFPSEFKAAVSDTLERMKARTPDLIAKGYAIAAQDKYRVESDGHLDDISGGNVTLKIERVTLALDPTQADQEKSPA